MTLNLPSKHRPLFSQRNFFEIDDSEEPQRKRQRTEDSQTIPDSLHLNGTDSESTETKSNNGTFVRLFDDGSSSNSSSHSRVQEDADDEIPNRYFFVLSSYFLFRCNTNCLLLCSSNHNRIDPQNVSGPRSASRGGTLSPIIGILSFPVFVSFGIYTMFCCVFQRKMTAKVLLRPSLDT